MIRPPLQLSEAAREIHGTCSLHDERLPFFFFTGAGISCPSVPLAPQIVAELQRGTSLVAPASLSAMESYAWWFENTHGSPADRQLFLRQLIENKNVTHANMRLAHILLSQKISKLVVTVNFDDFITRALELFGEPHIICDHPATIDRIDPEADDLQIVHVHGTYWFYDCCNLAGEIEDRSRRLEDSDSMFDFLDRVLSSRSPLVVGYSGWSNDVFMKALMRRLKRPLKFNLYWFCYRRAEIDALPKEMREHPQVRFVVPPEAPANVNNPATSVNTGALTKQAAAETAGSQEPCLPATQVFDELIRAFNLQAPLLARDPLGFLADHMRRFIPSGQTAEASQDIYFLSDVVDRIQRANEVLSRQQTRLASVQDALRRSQYREAVRLAVDIAPKDLSIQQLQQMMAAAASAGTSLLDDSTEELAAYELVMTAGDELALRGQKDPQTDGLIARALRNKGITLYNVNRPDEAIAAFDDLIARFRNAQATVIREEVAKALVNKGFRLLRLNRVQEAIATYVDTETLFGKDPDPVIQEHVAKALVNKGVALSQMDRGDEELATYKEAVERFGNSPEPNIRAQVAWALMYTGMTLTHLHREAEAVAAYGEVATRFGGDADPTLREQVAGALLNKGMTLGDLKRQEDAIAVFEDVGARFASAPEPAVREHAAKALVNKGVMLGQLNRNEEEIAVYTDVANRFGNATENGVRCQVAKALVYKAITLMPLKRGQEALAVCDDVVTRFGAATDPPLQEQVARALLNKAVALGQFDRVEEAAVVFAEIVTRFQNSSESALIQQVNSAVNGIGYCRLVQAKKAWNSEPGAVHTRLLEAQQKFREALERSPDNPTFLGNAAYAAFLLGDKQRSGELLARAITLGGESLRAAELADTEVQPVPEDEAFRDLVRSTGTGVTGAAGAV